MLRAQNECGSNASSIRTLTVSSPCTAPGAAPLVSPANAANVNGSTATFQWIAPSAGTAPFTYDLIINGSNQAGCTDLTSTSCTVNGLQVNGSSQTWAVRAKNSCGSSVGDTRTFVTCGQTSVPVADFTWSPSGTLTMANGYQQAQPYAGQLVTFTNSSTNGPFTDVSWYDFQGEVTTTIKTTNATHTFQSTGNKNVRLNVSNCFGQSSEKLKVVAIAADGRPAVADFDISPASPTVGGVVTFSAKTGQLYGDPDDFTWKFSDEETTRTGQQITRTFSCSKQVTLQLIAKSTPRNKTSQPTTKAVSVGGQPLCCTATQPPIATFSWQEQGTVTVDGVLQQQPYVGQLVHFTDPVPNTATAWLWEFAIQPTPNSPTTSSTEHLPTHTFAAAGSYLVRMTASNCFGSAAPIEQTITVYEDLRGVKADFTWSPGGAPAGSPITFTAADGAGYGDPDGFEWTFPGNVKKAGKVVQHSFNCGGANAVTLVAKRGATASQPTTKTVTTTGEPSCCKPPNRANSPTPKSGAVVAGGTVLLSWTRPTLGTDPLAYDVWLDGVKLPECSNLTEMQCSTVVQDGTETHFWKVIAKNECGTTLDTDTPPEWRFKACSATAAPDATTFTWDKNEPIEVGGVVQQQPYVGQTVTFAYQPTNQVTSWSWTDYQVSPATQYEVANPQIVYGSPGKKKLYLRVTNCAGTRSITQYIDVFADIRPVTARFNFSPAEPRDLDPVTFTFDTSDEVGSPNEFTIDFGDGTPPLVTTETSVQHAYACGKMYRATVTAKRIRPGSTVSSEPATQDVKVIGAACAATELMIVDMVRQTQRSNGVVERGDLVLFNPTAAPMLLELAILPDKDTAQVQTNLQLPPLPPQGTMAMADVMGLLSLDFSTATMWLKPVDENGGTLPVVNAWKYLEPVSGVKYGQFLPVFYIWPASDQTTTKWITGLVHNSLNAERGHYGFVTKLTFIDPTLKDPDHVAWGTRKLKLTLYDNATGKVLRVDSLNLDEFGGYRHDYINRIFHLPDTQDLKAVTVQVEVPPGLSVVVTSDMRDNYTENAVTFPSQTGP